MYYHMIAFLAGFLLDLLIGDPHWLYHPVRLIGNLIAALDHRLLDVTGIRNEKKEIIERRIYLTDTPYVQNCVYPYMQKNQQPIRKMSKDNIININYNN